MADLKILEFEEQRASTNGTILRTKARASIDGDQFEIYYAVEGGVGKLESIEWCHSIRRSKNTLDPEAVAAASRTAQHLDGVVDYTIEDPCDVIDDVDLDVTTIGSE